MSEKLPSSQEQPSEPSNRLESIRRALEEAAQDRAYDESRGASYLSTGAHAGKDRFMVPRSASSEDSSIDERLLSDRGDETGLDQDKNRLDQQQAEADAWANEGKKLGRRRVFVDVKAAHAPPSKKPSESSWNVGSDGALDAAYASRKKGADIIFTEKTDFMSWETELTDTPEKVKPEEITLAEDSIDVAFEAINSLHSEHQEVSTPEGPLSIDIVKVDDEILIQTASNDESIVSIESLTDLETGEIHTIEADVMNNGEAHILLDGEEVDPEDMETVTATINHVRETIQEIAQGTETTPKNLDKQAKQFFNAMKSNEGARRVMVETLGSSGISIEDFNTALDKVTPEDLQQMKSLFNEAGPRSAIWNEKSGNSLLGRAAKEQKDRLSTLITAIASRK